MSRLNNVTRIKVKWHLAAMSHAICLQRKSWWGWNTVSWIYPSIMKDATCEHIEDWLFWEEGFSHPNEKDIGKEIIEKCEFNNKALSS